MNGPDDMDETTNRTPDGNPNSSWEIEMGEEFERRVRDLHAAPLDLGSVRGTAMRIRNKRRATIAGAVLAAAAVIVPVAVLATNGSTNGAEGIDPAATPSSVVTDASTPTPKAPETTPDPSQPATPQVDDAQPGFDYLEVDADGTTYHRADGTTAELPGTSYLGATDLGDQIAAWRSDDLDGRFVDLIEGGQVATTYDVRSDTAVAPDGRTIAFITTDDELLFVNGDHGQQSFGPIERGINLSAIVGNGDCVLESGCHPFLEYDDFTQTDAFEINYEGPNTAPAPGAMRVNDAADGFLVSVQTESTDTGSCGGLYDREGGGRWVFRTCTYQVLDISPTGDHVIGADPYGDGPGPSSFSILDTDGEEVARYDTDPGFVVGNYSWRDDTHVVAVVNDAGAWKVVSLGVDGSVEELLGPVEGVDFPEPFLLVGGDAG